VAERLAELGVPAEEAQWDSRKRGDNTWQVQLMFTVGGRPQMAEWSFDPRRRHVSPADDDAARLSLPEADVAALGPSPIAPMRATVTPIGSRLAAAPAPVPAAAPAPPPAPAPERVMAAARPGPPSPAQPRPAATTASPAQASPAQASPAPGHSAPAGTAAAAAGPAVSVSGTGADPAAPDPADPGSPDRPEQAPAAAESQEPATAQRGRARKAAGGRSRRSSVPSWDEIMFGTSRQPD
jgi:hypothetical protein